MDKKAQGLSINAIILIVMGLAVLVILILGFMIGWDKVVPWFGEKNNVDTVAKACQTACNSENLYNYCSFTRKLSDGTSTYKNVTCYILSTVKVPFSQYGVSECAIDCKKIVKCDKWNYADIDGITVKKLNEGEYSSYCTSD